MNRIYLLLIFFLGFCCNLWIENNYNTFLFYLTSSSSSSLSSWGLLLWRQQQQQQQQQHQRKDNNDYHNHQQHNNSSIISTNNNNNNYNNMNKNIIRNSIICKKKPKKLLRVVASSSRNSSRRKEQQQNNNNKTVVVTSEVINEKSTQSLSQQQQQQQQQQNNNRRQLNGVDDNNNNHNDICQIVSKELIKNMFGGDDNNNDRQRPNILPNTGSIWTYYTKSIFDASQYYNDTTNIYHDFISELMKFMTPIRMSKSSKSLPYISNSEQIDRIINIIYNRYVYVHNYQMNNPKNNNNVKQDPPRKLNIIVLGGSVTGGGWCSATPIQTNNTEEDRQRYPPMENKECCWSGRLQEFINKLLKGSMTQQQRKIDNNNKDGLILDTDIIQVYNFAVGGTDTEKGTDLWDYSLLPDDVLANIDIIITAYSTNDSMHAIKFVETEPNDKHASEKYLHDMIQTYIRTVLSKTEKYNDPTCKEYKLKRKPLVLLYDEYMGYNRASIYQQYTFNRVISMLSKYYGVGYISYSDTVRDIYYTFTNEKWFTAPAPNVHPGQGFHISSMWIITYTILDYITSYCSSSNTIIPNVLQNNNNNNNDDLQYKDIPKKKPLLAIPPPISWDYNMNDISNIWRRHEQERQIKDTQLLCKEKTSNKGNQKACLFDIGRGGYGPSCCQNDTISYNNGWIYSEDHHKRGFVPQGGINSTFIMNFPNIKQSVNVLNIVYMISYGPSWENSHINITTSVLNNDTGNKVITTNEYSALNDQETSISIDQKAYIIANVGDTIEIQFKFITGITFKLIGLALCDH